MSNIGIFVDTSDLYHKVQREFGRGSKVCYETYYSVCEDVGDIIIKAVAYGMRGETSSFPNCLSLIGFDSKFKSPRIFTSGDRKIKKCDWNVALTLDVVEFVLENRSTVVVKDYDTGDIEKINTATVIIGSSNSLLIPLVKWVKEQGVKVIVFAARIPESLKENTDESIKVDSDCLELEEENVRES